MSIDHFQVETLFFSLSIIFLFDFNLKLLGFCAHNKTVKQNLLKFWILPQFAYTPNLANLLSFISLFGSICIHQQCTIMTIMRYGFSILELSPQDFTPDIEHSKEKVHRNNAKIISL